MSAPPRYQTSETEAPAFQLPPFARTSLVSIRGLSPLELTALLDRADAMATAFRDRTDLRSSFSGQTQINLFYENSTRTQSSFEIAAKRLGLDVINMAVGTSSVKKGESFLDTAATLNAMRPDLLVMRHPAAGAAELLSAKVSCGVINAGDGAHEHPTQALLDALTIRRRKGRIEGLRVCICGDVAHSRVARSNMLLLTALGAQVRIVAPSTLLPTGVADYGVKVFGTMEEGLADCDVVMMLRLQRERMEGSLIPSPREYFTFFGLDRKRLALAKDDAIVMHPGPMNRGVEIATTIADGVQSVIVEQVEMGVAVRMAVIAMLLESRRSQANAA